MLPLTHLTIHDPRVASSFIAINVSSVSCFSSVGLVLLLDWKERRGERWVSLPCCFFRYVEEESSLVVKFEEACELRFIFLFLSLKKHVVGLI